ncbi:unnamed protein product [Discula destructiva]
MAETFGIVAGAVGIATVFTTCVDCFKYVQLGRHFEQDYQTNFVTLKLLEVRLSRWGTAVAIYDDPRLGNPNATSDEINVAKQTLSQILVLFSESKKKSDKFRSGQITGPGAVYTMDDVTDPGLSGLIRKTNNIVLGRTKEAGLRKKTAWALFERESLVQLVADTSGLLDQLERLFPAQNCQRKLADQDIAEIREAISLEYLQKLTAGIDKILQDRVMGIETQQGRHHFGPMAVKDRALVQNGNVFKYPKQSTDSTPAAGGATGTGHDYTSMEMSDDARVQNGDMFGCSVFD